MPGRDTMWLLFPAVATLFAAWMWVRRPRPGEESDPPGPVLPDRLAEGFPPPLHEQWGMTRSEFAAWVRTDREPL